MGRCMTVNLTRHAAKNKIRCKLPQSNCTRCVLFKSKTSPAETFSWQLLTCKLNPNSKTFELIQLNLFPGSRGGSFPATSLYVGTGFTRAFYPANSSIFVHVTESNFLNRFCIFTRWLLVLVAWFFLFIFWKWFCTVASFVACWHAAFNFCRLHRKIRSGGILSDGECWRLFFLQRWMDEGSLWRRENYSTLSHS